MHFVEKLLEEAARRGDFDPPPGPPRPIDLAENPFVRPEWRLAFKVMADHRLVPEFVERRKEIETLRAEIEAERPRRRPAILRALAVRLRDAVDALNRSLARETDFVRGSLQLPPVDVDAELSRASSAPPPGRP
jgi:hypothetical protein